MLRVTLLLGLALPSLLTAAPRTVEIEGTDGFALAGTLWQDDASAAGLLLLHACDAERSMYDEMGAKLAAAGFRVLAFDFRGLGASTDATWKLGDDASEEAWDEATAKYPEDVEAAYQFLAMQGDGPVVGAIGTSCGGRQMVALAQAHEDLRLLGFVSARLDALETRDALQLRERLKLLVTAKADTGAATAMGTLAYRSRAGSDMVLFDGSSHGVALFEEHPELTDKIVTWFAEKHAAAP
jgi:predicted alpha/beta hydrolase